MDSGHYYMVSFFWFMIKIRQTPLYMYLRPRSLIVKASCLELYFISRLIFWRYSRSMAMPGTLYMHCKKSHFYKMQIHITLIVCFKAARSVSLYPYIIIHKSCNMLSTVKSAYKELFGTIWKMCSLKPEFLINV